LGVAFHARKAYLKFTFGWNRVYVMTLHRWDGRRLLARFEGNHLEGHAENLGDFFGQSLVIPDIVTSTP
jgi:hypothetical protein